MKPAKLSIRALNEAAWDSVEPHVASIVEAATQGEEGAEIKPTNLGVKVSASVGTCEFIYDMIRLHMLALTLSMEVDYDA